VATDHNGSRPYSLCRGGPSSASVTGASHDDGLAEGQGRVAMGMAGFGRRCVDRDRLGDRRVRSVASGLIDHEKTMACLHRRAKDHAPRARLISTVTPRLYLVLAFDEIRHYGADSVQVVRRLRSALVGLANSVTDDTRIGALQRYLKQLDLTVDHSILTADDQETARQEDRQGLGLPRRQRTSP
jgi:hypothetical protein